jgi:hypothetical protein
MTNMVNNGDVYGRAGDWLISVLPNGTRKRYWCSPRVVLS